MVIAVFGGITSATGAVLGALWVEGIPRLLGEGYALLSSGLGVILILLLMPGGLATLVFGLRDRFVSFVAGRHERAGVGRPARRRSLRASRRWARIRGWSGHRTGSPAAPSGAAPLVASDVTVRFGGLRGARRRHRARLGR